MVRKIAAFGITILFLSALFGTLFVRAQTRVRTVTPLGNPSPPAPVITAWGPKDKVATGEILWFQGTNLDRGLFVVTLGDRTILPHLYFELLPTASSTSNRIEVRTTSAMKTGIQTSTPLKVLHRGGAPVTIDPDYHVVDRNARFSGISQYHAGNSTAYHIFTEGDVQIVLKNLDFADQGTGTYSETVRLVHKIKTTEQRCPPPGLKMNYITVTDWYTARPQPSPRQITWKRDPAVNTRIVVYGVGVLETLNVNATIDGTGIQCGYATHVGNYGPSTSESGCGLTNPPLRPSPPAYVVYSLRRAI